MSALECRITWKRPEINYTGIEYISLEKVMATKNGDLVTTEEVDSITGESIYFEAIVHHLSTTEIAPSFSLSYLHCHNEIAPDSGRGRSAA